MVFRAATFSLLTRSFTYPKNHAVIIRAATLVTTTASVAAYTLCDTIEDKSSVGNKNKKIAVASKATHPVVSPLAMQAEFDVAVVGGGIIGLATAREIQKRFPGKTVCVIEKEREVAPHQSSHNSGVIHAGMYYEPGTDMAKTCVRGAKLMYDYLESRKLPYERVGKLIVAVNEKEDEQVRLLFDRGTKNGVLGLQVLNSDEIKQKEPAVSKAYSALWSPNTGIADYGVVSRSLAGEIIASGKGDVKLEFEVQKIDKTSDGRVVITGVEPGQKGPSKRVIAKNVIACAGFHSDRVAGFAGGASDPKVVTFRGTYYQMKAPYKDIVKTNVYPVPSGGGIPVGVHFTPTVNERRGHQMIIGPGACLTFKREGYSFFDISLSDLWGSLTNGGLVRFAVQNPSLSLGEVYKDLNRAAFLKEAQKLVPSLRDDMVEESFAGVMAQVFLPDGSAAKDYIFERKLLDGKVLSLRNAPSPAATASLAIAEKLVTLAEDDFAWK
jgi:L-2-hydroxyglutarate oxidase LhgO